MDTLATGGGTTNDKPVRYPEFIFITVVGSCSVEECRSRECSNLNLYRSERNGEESVKSEYTLIDKRLFARRVSILINF